LVSGAASFFIAPETIRSTTYLCLQKQPKPVSANAKFLSLPP
jgi:hypothetical protein